MSANTAHKFRSRDAVLSRLLPLGTALVACVLTFCLATWCLRDGRSVPQKASTASNALALRAEQALGARLEEARKNGIASMDPTFLMGLRQWLSDDPASALSFLHSHSAEGIISQPEIMQILVSRTKSDPRAIVDIARGIEDRQLADRLYRRAFEIALQQSGEEALDLVSLMPTHLAAQMEAQAAKKIAESTGAIGVEGALPRFTNQFAAQTALETLVRKDPGAAFSLFDKYQNIIADLPPFGKQGAMGMIGWLVGVGQPDTALTLDWLRQKPASPFIDSQIVETLAQAVAKNPQAASSIIQSYNATSMNDLVLGQAAVRVAKNDPSTALQLIGNITSYSDRIQAYRETGYWLGVAQTDLAVNFVASIPNTFDRGQSLNSLAQPLLKANPTAFFEDSAPYLQDPVFSRTIFSILAAALDTPDPSLSSPPLSSLRTLSPSAKAQLLQAVPTLFPTSQRSLLSTLLH